MAESPAQLHSNTKDGPIHSTTNTNTKQIPKKRKHAHLINPNNNQKNQRVLKSFGLKEDSSGSSPQFDSTYSCIRLQ